MSCPTSPSRTRTARNAPCRRPWPRAGAPRLLPFAFSGICTGELSEIRDDLGAFDNDGSRSGDPVTRRPAAGLGGQPDEATFPLLSPILAARWGRRQLRDPARAGFAVRGTFLVDADRVIRWALVNGPGERRDSTRIAEVMATAADPAGPSTPDCWTQHRLTHDVVVRRRRRRGPVAQLVERHVYTVDVVGSRPAGPPQDRRSNRLRVISASARAPSRAGPA